MVNHPSTPSADHPVWEFFWTSYNIGKISEKEVETLSKEAGDVLMQKRILGAKLAKTEAEAKAREAERATALPQYRHMELWGEGFTGDEENPEGEPEVSAGSPA